jgi:hypothetical protein
VCLSIVSMLSSCKEKVWYCKCMPGLKFYSTTNTEIVNSGQFLHESINSWPGLK